MGLEITDNHNTIHYSSWVRVQGFNSLFSNDHPENPVWKLLTSAKKYRVRAALSLTPGDPNPMWGPKFQLGCCGDWIRPTDQKTIYLSGEVTQSISTNYDRIHIARDAIIKTSIDTYWEITTEDSITFVADFFEPTISPFIKTQKHIFLKNTTLELLWFPANPLHRSPKQSLALVYAPISPMFKEVTSSKTEDCEATNVLQKWVRQKDGLTVTFQTECIQSCSIHENIFLVFSLGAGLFVPTMFFILLKIGKRNPFGRVMLSNQFLKILIVASLFTGMILCPLLSAALVVLVSRWYCVSCHSQSLANEPPEEAEAAEPATNPRSRAKAYLFNMFPAVSFLWITQAIPPLFTWFVVEPVKESRLIYKWLSIYLPIVGGLFLVLNFMVVLLQCDSFWFLSHFVKQDLDMGDQYTELTPLIVRD